MLLAFAVVALAQAVVTNTVPDVSGAPLPATTSEFWTYGIAIVVPLIVGLMKKLVPNIPTWALPVSTPFLGLLLGFLLKLGGWANMSWIDMAQAGGLAVLIRESWNQIVTKNLGGPSAAKTPTP